MDVDDKNEPSIWMWFHRGSVALAEAILKPTDNSWTSYLNFRNEDVLYLSKMLNSSFNMHMIL